MELSEVLSGKKNLAKGIKVEVSENIAKIDVNIIVEYGSRITKMLAFEIQNRVKKVSRKYDWIKCIRG
ncbi:MAG: Asp23/Gls24 family envelope stress response protein [Clostridia bacterium]